jgi:hypothetical protein
MGFPVVGTSYRAFTAKKLCVPGATHSSNQTSKRTCGGKAASRAQKE